MIENTTKRYKLFLRQARGYSCEACLTLPDVAWKANARVISSRAERIGEALQGVR